MNEKNTAVQTPEEDYRIGFMPKVHRIGRLTMAVAFVLSFLPVAYFYVVKGYQVPISMYISGAIGVASIGVGMWISEPEAYWPVLGSAGTYIAYLSGNVGGMRFPVATAVQKNANADTTTPKGQVITIIGIVASVVANLVILLAIVLAGNWILSILPEAVLSAFGFCVISMMGSMMVMNVSTRGGLKSLPGQLPYIIFGVVMWYICNKVLTSLMAWGMALAVGGAVLIGYFKYRRDLAKAEAGDK